MTSATLTRPAGPTPCCCVDQILSEWSPEELRAAVYAGFLYGYGEVPGLDLGRPIAYTRTGSIYRQEFEHGITLANVGEETVDFHLGRGYLDLANVLCRYALLPPHSGQLLIKLR
jgi:hypothetical protein